MCDRPAENGKTCISEGPIGTWRPVATTATHGRVKRETPEDALRKMRNALRKIGRRIADVRLERGMTQEALAARLGVTARYLRRVEAGREEPHGRHAGAFCQCAAGVNDLTGCTAEAQARHSTRALI